MKTWKQIAIVGLMVIAGLAKVEAFDPFAWRTNGIDYKIYTDERIGKRIRFKHDGIVWDVRYPDSKSEHVAGHYGDWDVYLSWDGPLGEPSAFTSTDSTIKDVDTNIMFSYSCSADPDVQGWQGWKFDLDWNYRFFGELDFEQRLEFKQKRGMRSGTYRIRIDNDTIRNVPMLADDPEENDRPTFHFLDHSALVEDEEDQIWLTQQVKSGSKLRAMVKTWNVSHSSYIGSSRRVEYSLNGSRRMITIAENHCRRSPRDLD